MNLISPTPKLSGRYKIEAFVPGNPPRVLADWFENLITDYGLNALNKTSSYVAYYCCVGTGNTPPALSDTQLHNVKAGSYSVVSDTGGKKISEGYLYTKKTYRFEQGSAAGTLAEVGMGSEENGTKLFSRALIKDATGNPTTVAVLPDEILQVTWELRLYIPVAEASGVINIAGSGDHDFTLLPCMANHEYYWNGALPRYDYFRFISIYSELAALAPITGDPVSSKSQFINYPNTTLLPYAENSLTRGAKLNLDISQANFPNGINGFTFVAGYCGNKGDLSYQVLLDPPIMKTANDSLSLTVSASWARA